MVSQAFPQEPQPSQRQIVSNDSLLLEAIARLPTATAVPTSATPASDAQIGRANWTSAQKTYLLQRLVEFKEQGKASDTGFKKEAWVSLLLDFNRHFQTKYSETQLKTQFTNAKKEYKQFKSLSVSGFGWNEDSQQLEADPEVWAEMIEKHDYVKKFRDFPFPNRSLMHRLFDAVIATGQYAVSSTTSTSTVNLPLETNVSATPPTVANMQAPSSLTNSATPSTRSRQTTVNSQASQLRIGLLSVEGSTLNKSPTPARSTSPRKKPRKEGGLSQLSTSIEASRLTMETIKNELSIALHRFIEWSSKRIMSGRTKVLCKQIISSGKNATVFLCLGEDEYKDWFELMFEQNGHRQLFEAELLREPSAVQPDLAEQGTGTSNIVTQTSLFTGIPTAAQLAVLSDDDDGEGLYSNDEEEDVCDESTLEA